MQPKSALTTTNLSDAAPAPANEQGIPGARKQKSERDRLIESHLPFVRGLAAKLRLSIGGGLEFEDLVAYGAKGLIEAADRFNPNLGVAFKTFAYYRIKGAMLDGIRVCSWYSRSDLARYRLEERVNGVLQEEADQRLLDLAPAEAQDALTSIADTLCRIAAVNITSLYSEQMGADGYFGASGEALAVVDESVASPDHLLENRQLVARIHRALTGLPDKERRLIELYYFDDMTLEEAGAELGLSKSWVCRLHARAVELLRQALGSEE